MHACLRAARALWRGSVNDIPQVKAAVATKLLADGPWQYGGVMPSRVPGTAYRTPANPGGSEDFLAEAREHQLDAQGGGSVVQIDHRIDFAQLTRNHCAAIGDQLERPMRFAVGHAAAHRRAHAGRIRRIDKIHI